jgi:hypothetical protein
LINSFFFFFFVQVSTTPPLTGLQALKLGFPVADLCYVGPSDKPHVENLTDIVWHANRETGKSWHWWEGGVTEMVEEVFQGRQGLLDLALLDAVELNGTLRAGLVDDLMALRYVEIVLFFFYKKFFFNQGIYPALLGGSRR